MENIRKLIKDVLEKGYLMSLATVDETGPWVSDVIVIHDDAFNLYWLSLPTRRHSVALEKDPRVAATITLAQKDEDDKIGIQVQGTAEMMDRVDAKVVEAYGKRINKTSIDGQVFAPGQKWYRLKPSKIDLVHQPLFGHEKQFWLN